MRKVAATGLLLMMAMAGTSWAAHPGTYEEARSQAVKSGKPLLMDFFTVW